MRWAALLLAALVALLVASHLWVARVYAVSSGSMVPTLDAGERVLVSLLGRDDVRRGDLVVAEVSSTWGAHDPGAGTVLKRVVGLPGERVACCDDSGRLTVDGRPLDEPYLADGAGDPFDVVVPDGRLWLLGDDRVSSRDSRHHLGSPGGGSVATSAVVGRVIAVVWPPVRALERPAR